jgi:hypothetical protein
MPAQTVAPHLDGFWRAQPALCEQRVQRRLVDDEHGPRGDAALPHGAALARER